MSVFICFMPSAGLRDSPPLSKVMPLPIEDDVPVRRRAGCSRSSIRRGGLADPDPTASRPPNPSPGQFGRFPHPGRQPAVRGHRHRLAGQPGRVLPRGRHVGEIPGERDRRGHRAGRRQLILPVRRVDQQLDFPRRASRCHREPVATEQQSHRERVHRGGGLPHQRRGQHAPAGRRPAPDRGTRGPHRGRGAVAQPEQQERPGATGAARHTRRRTHPRCRRHLTVGREFGCGHPQIGVDASRGQLLGGQHDQVSRRASVIRPGQEGSKRLRAGRGNRGQPGIDRQGVSQWRT